MRNTVSGCFPRCQTGSLHGARDFLGLSAERHQITFSTLLNHFWAFWPSRGANNCSKVPPEFGRKDTCHVKAVKHYNRVSETPCFFQVKIHITKLTPMHLWGLSGRGHCRKFSANFREISATFRRHFRTLSSRNKTYFCKFPRTSAEFPQTFRNYPFASNPISEPVKIHRKSPQIVNCHGHRKLLRSSILSTAGSFGH